MRKISDSDEEHFYGVLDEFRKCVDEGFKRIETTRESIWSVHPKWKGCFHVLLSICGVAVISFTLYTKWDKSWIELFDALWKGFAGSVVIVWFLIRLVESAMSALLYFQNKIKESNKKNRQKITDKAHKSILDRLNALPENASKDDVIQAIRSVCSSTK